MTEGQILDLMRSAMFHAASMAMPLLLTALITGLVVGLFQALTSIQEMTLTFVPKLGVIVIVFWLSVSGLSHTIISFFDQQILAVVMG